MSARVDLTGKRYGKLVVFSLNGIRITPQGKKRSYWNCSCDCGRESVVNAGNLNYGNVLSCGCIKKKNGSAFRQLLCAYKTGARARNLLFEISANQLKKLTSSGCCYCGLKPEQVSKTKPKYGNPEVYLYNGIDRLDNTKGYIKGNCAPRCKRCNNAKKTLSQNDFLNMIEEIFNYRLRENHDE